MVLYQMRQKSAFALLAQLDRVTDYESVGQGFESLAAHQIKRETSISLSLFLFGVNLNGDNP